MYHCAINPRDVTWIVNTLYATRIHLSIINLLPFLVAERPPRRLSWRFRLRLGPWAPRVLDHLICSLFQAATPMAYRRRQGISRSPTFKEEIHCPPNEDNFSSSNFFFPSLVVPRSPGEQGLGRSPRIVALVSLRRRLCFFGQREGRQYL